MSTSFAYPEVETEETNDDHEGVSIGFLETFLHQLRVQSGVVIEEDIGSHPDLLIRRCLKGLLDSLVSDHGSPLGEVIVALPSLRKHIDATHLADLIARSAQFLFRKDQDDSYMQFTENDWQQFFSNLTPDQLDEMKYTLVHKEVATHVLTRYRGLAALCSFRYRQAQVPLRVADIGSSLNLGLRASIKGTAIHNELNTLTDLTDDQFIMSLLKSRRPAFNDALGIDIQAPDFEWVAACAYFSKYEETRAALQRYLNLLNADGQNGIPINSMVADISEEATVHRIQTNHPENFDIIYGSMVLYQLSKKMRDHAIHNINALLRPNGLFAELTFKNTRNWFLPWNAVTTVRFKEGTTFSQPYQWVEWDSSRCFSVRPGRDYDIVNVIMGNN